MSENDLVERLYREVGAMQLIMIAFVIAILMLNYGYSSRLSSLEDYVSAHAVGSQSTTGGGGRD
jgi:hypothetical protein